MSAAAPAPASPMSRVQSEVMRIRGFLQGSRFAEALTAATALGAEVPENRDVLYMIAVSQRYLGRIKEALQTLAHLQKLHPRFSLLYQERGHCFIASHDPAAAFEAYLTAVNINVALPASWKALEVLCRSAGRSTDAANAAAHVAKLASLPPPVVTATGLFADGETPLAEGIIREFLLSHPTDVEAMRLLAKIGMQMEILDDAEFLLESVLQFAPNYHLARYDYALVLLHRHKHARALEEANKLLEVDPGNISYRTVHANVCVALGSYDQALKRYRELLADAPQMASIHLSIAHACKTLGRQQDAIDAYHAAASVAPSFGDAYWSLANLKTYRFRTDELAHMRRQEALDTTQLVDRYHLCFALGKALEDLGEYAESFQYYERGNSLKKSETRFRIEPIERNTRLQISVCTEGLIASRRGGCDRPDPIFVVGLPRAGSTLIEQILASHSQVEGTMELADIPRLVHKLQGREENYSSPRYPAVLAELTPDELKGYGEKYLQDTQIYRSGKAFFIDKMPNNFRHLGLIHLILPNAKVIDARREPMACCFSNFKQLFATGQEFTYSLQDIARYYRAYVELMSHWERALPGKILRIQYEDLVEDLEGHVRRMLDFCGLAFEPACLEYYKTERSVRTASSEQVRQPIFKESLEQWRRFEPWLGELKSALGEFIPLTLRECEVPAS